MAGRRSGAPLPEKICAACGRSMTHRRRRARSREQVRYCFDACRRCGVIRVDEELERQILALLAARTPRASICPGEVAPAVAGEEDWRALMGPTRRAARRLVRSGRLRILQRGREVDPDEVRGPMRLALAHR